MKNKPFASLEAAPLRRTLARVLAPLVFGIAAVTASAAPSRDTLTLLVPDGVDRGSWQVKVWTDSAAEEGIRLELLTDTQFLALGAAAASKVAGLVVPDSAHISASAAVVTAIKQYAFTGGKLMLVYDAGALDERGFYPLNDNSRFADMVGVDYVLYNSLRDRVVGFGPVIGTQARLESLSLPPGKYLPYGVLPPSVTTPTATAAFVPTSRFDPGGTQLLREKIQERAARAGDEGADSGRRMRLRTLQDALGVENDPSLPLRFDRRVEKASRARDEHVKDRVVSRSDAVRARMDGDNPKEVVPTGATTTTPASTTLQAISGYAYGALGYFHYVTVGDFPGKVYLSSPAHGLVAGLRSYGSGQVLFVNMPLGYFKAIGTDSVPLHGFLNLFAREQVGLASMSVQPRGVGGLIYNWHVDDGDDLTSDTKFLLDHTKVFKRGPYSIQFTAGPDVITFGDGNGMNLGVDPVAQDFVRRLGNLGKHGGKLPVQHELGAHGGWIHDYWGATAKETNESKDLTDLLKWNFDAVEKTTGRKITEYSSPTGNTPLWALRWLEARGVKSAYTAGDGGAATLRSWRAGGRVANTIWNVPVTPLGRYATFEEFDEFGIDDTVSGQWLLDLQSFVVNQRTNRMFYNHPPGARAHLPAINPLLIRADKLEASGSFRWYTMTQLATFSQRRVETAWQSTSSGGYSTFNASHPASLADMTWLLPRARYDTPRVVSGSATVTSDSVNWVVAANGGTALRFTALER